MNGWGTSYFPFLNKKFGTSSLVDINYTHPKLQGWKFSGSVAADTGTMLGKKRWFQPGRHQDGDIKSLVTRNYLYLSHKAEAMISCV